MNSKTIKIKRNIENNIKKTIKENLEIVNIERIKNNISYFENISLSLDNYITETLERMILNEIEDQEIKAFILDLLNENDLFSYYEFMNNRLYLEIVKLLSENITDLTDIKKHEKEFYKNIDEDEIEFIENLPILEIQIDLNFSVNEKDRDYPINIYQLDNKMPLLYYGDRLCYQDDQISPYSSIMLTKTL